MDDITGTRGRFGRNTQYDRARTTHLHQTYIGPEAERFTLEPPPYGAGWPEVAHEADEIFVCDKEPHEPGAYFYLLLAYVPDKNEVARKRIGG